MRVVVAVAAALLAVAGCTALTGFDQPAEQGAQCRDGVDNDGNGLQDCEEASCAAACVACGNGTLDEGEECDDGNQDDTDACRSTCVAARCGDGVVRAGVETCDDGNQDDTDGCPDGADGTCEPARCGDGVVRAGVEECDDGNPMPADGCDPVECVVTCGDGVAADRRAFDPSTRRCYFGFAAAPLDAFGANEQCLGLGGYLAVPDDTAENDLIRVAAPPSASLGLADVDLDDGYGFRVVTGDLPAAYLNFSAGQPDEPLDDVICVGFDGDLTTWQDTSCAVSRPYVCEVHEEPCGDRVRQPDEGCDDGNTIGGDGCAPGCVDEDECMLGTDNCSPDADCINQPWQPGAPGFACVCQSGFVGDGVTCVPAPPPPVFEPRAPAPISGPLEGCATGVSSAGRKIAIDAFGVLYAVMVCGGEAYVVRSTDAGATWSTPSLLGDDVVEVAVVGLHQGRAVVGLMRSTGEVVVHPTTDFGQSWGPPRQVTTAADPASGLGLATDGVALLVSATVSGVLRVHRADDPGLTAFGAVDTVPAVFGDVLVDPLDGSHVWAVSDTPDLHLLDSNDGGVTFPGAEATPAGGQEYSDWAIGGASIFVTGAAPQIGVIPMAAPDTITVVAGLPDAPFGQRAITSDPAGVAVVAQASTGGGIYVVRLPSGAGALDAPVEVDPSGQFPGVVAVPNGLVAVVYTASEQVRVAIIDPTPPPPALALVHRWSFETGTAVDDVGTADGALFGGATIVAGQLVLDGVDDYLRTPAVSGPIFDRTLVAWVALDNLTQGGGSALTIEDPTGADLFDAIVFGEATPSQWWAGSNNGVRSLAGVGPEETTTAPTLVMMAITHAPDGTIALYRDGVPYGLPYNPGPVQVYTGGVADVLIGVRHEDVISSPGTATGFDPYLAGAIEEARIYERALTPTEIQALYAAGPNG